MTELDIRLAPTRLYGLVLLVLLIGGCGQTGSSMQCTGNGSVRGSYQNTNDGALSFDYGVAWRTEDGGYRVVFTDDAKLAEALRASPAPDREMHRLGQMLGELLVGFEFHADGKYYQRITQGSSTSSGWSGGDVGAAKLDKEGCLRGDVTLDSYGGGHFALPLLSASNATASSNTQIQRDTRQQKNVDRARTEETQDPLSIWQKAFARLTQPHPAVALQALGFSAPSASVLADDKRIKPVLARLRGQCPDPHTANANEYGEIIGAAHPKAGVVLSATGVASIGPDGAAINNCYVMQRNGQSIDQCWPLTTDCTATAFYQPD
jgi:hypothetical protein